MNATPKQIALAARLMEERVLPTDFPELTADDLARQGKKEISALIDALMKAPRKDGRRADAPSPKQVAFFQQLLAERGLPVVEPRADATAKEISAAIDALMALPKKVEVKGKDAELPDVPAGKYALVEDDATVFYKLDRPERGRYVGRVFLSRMHGDNHEPIKDHGAKFEVIARIAADVEGAARRYGHHRNECAYCKHDLTDPFSRFFGIGPVCAKKRGMPFSFASYVKRGGSPAQVEVNEWLAEDAEVGNPRAPLTDRDDFDDRYETRMERDQRLFDRDNEENFTPETPAHLA